MQINSEILVRLVPEILEKSAMMLAEPLRDPPLSIDSPLIEAQISFSGHANGDLTLLCPESFCLLAAASMLGLDEDELVQAQAEDVLAELTNVLCGQLLTAIAGTTPVFKLSMPNILRREDFEWPTFAALPEFIAFEAEGHPLLVKITMQESV
ncbi:MAG: hypothetical protein A2X49_10670 [Lentisphaerae bacterium GWF2_52_8]|nr:MAG: hypothetical protein A2X49_10670 [Lentisphaerae bacterium GWF2_52_8]